VKLPVIFRSSSWLAVCGDGNFWLDAAKGHAWTAGRYLRVSAAVGTTPDLAPLVWP